MYLRYGNWTSDLAECEVTIVRSPIYTDSGQKSGYKERWNITGFAQANTSALLTTELTERENAFALQGQGIALLFSDLSFSKHRLDSTSCYGGTRVVEGVNYPNQLPAEYASASSHRTWTAAVEGEVHDTSYNYILGYYESISYEGTGGPINRFLPVLVGYWQKQTVHTHSTFRAVQEGEIVGKYGYLPHNPPLFPLDLHHERAGIKKKAPKKLYAPGAVVYTEWTTSWRWEFENAFNPYLADPIPQVG